MGDRPVICVSLDTACTALCGELRQLGWQAQPAPHLAAAAQMLAGPEPYAVGLLVVRAADAARIAEIDAFLCAHDGLEWVGAFEAGALDAPGGAELVVDHLFDHHTLPCEAARLAATLGHAWGHAALRRSARHAAPPAGDVPIIGDSAPTKTLLAQIRRVAGADAPVLVTGESGSGKELTAQAVHHQSSRAGGPFVPVNCGAIQPTLLQSELFGHAKGSFTGALRETRGLIEAAAGGTIFLDEIGDLSLESQVSLLRFLQESTVTRVGSTKAIRVDVRVIAATHVDLEAAVRAGLFREDLYYRLNVLPLRVPALRDRPSDIPLLAQHFFAKFASQKNARLKGFSRPAMAAMQAHAWPGNVRELINRVVRAMVMAPGRLITHHDLGLDTRRPVAPEPLTDARLLAERSALHRSLELSGRNVTEAAGHLGVSRMTLYRLMAKHGITH